MGNGGIIRMKDRNVYVFPNGAKFIKEDWSMVFKVYYSGMPQAVLRNILWRYADKQIKSIGSVWVAEYYAGHWAVNGIWKC